VLLLRRWDQSEVLVFFGPLEHASCVVDIARVGWTTDLALERTDDVG